MGHAVPPVASHRGGTAAARRALRSFLRRLDGYADPRHPDANATSGLAAALPLGHRGIQEAVAAVLQHQDWTPARLGKPRGQRKGWWGTQPGAEAFLDELVTWRDLAHLEARHNRAHDRYAGLPAWARATLEAHAKDPRRTYRRARLERAETHDVVWNAAQRQLVHAGTVHTYLRMLWGKKILAWSPTPRAAFARMLHLNDKYALDGRDPNSVAGIAWCLGRYDRAGPERPVFGKVRTMTSRSARRKLRLAAYLKEWWP